LSIYRARDGLLFSLPTIWIGKKLNTVRVLFLTWIVDICLIFQIMTRVRQLENVFGFSNTLTQEFETTFMIHK